MRSAFLFVALFVVCALGAPQLATVRYAGTTTGSADFAPPSFASDGTCTTASYAAPHVIFNHTFTEAGVYQVSAMAEDDFKSELSIYVYDTTFDAAQPCAHVLGVGLVKQNDLPGGPVIDDYIYFEPRVYHFVVTGEGTDSAGIFAVNIFPSTVTGHTDEHSPEWRPAYPDYYWNCDYDTYYVGKFAKLVWVQEEGGVFDIFGIFSNSSLCPTCFYTHLALYKGNITNDTALWENPCNETTLEVDYLGSNDANSKGVGIVYQQLNASETYTLVISGRTLEHVGYWGVQIVPTKIRFPINDPVYVQPDVYSTDGCEASSNNAAWDAQVFMAEFQAAYIIDTSEPYAPFAYFDTYSFLYKGNNTGSEDTAPATCPLLGELVSWGDTGDVTPVYSFVDAGHLYTVVVSTYSGSTVSTDGAAYMLYVMSGAPIGSIPSSTTGTPATTGATAATTGATGATGATTAAATGATGATGATTAHGMTTGHNETDTTGATSAASGQSTTGNEPVATTTSDTTSVFVSVIALAVTALIAVLL